LPIISGARMMKDYLKFIFPKPQIQPKKRTANQANSYSIITSIPNSKSACPT
jgi:hypothetical protein